MEMNLLSTAVILLNGVIVKPFNLLNRIITNGKRTSRLPKHDFATLNPALDLMGGLKFGLSGTSTVRIYEFSHEIRDRFRQGIHDIVSGRPAFRL